MISIIDGYYWGLYFLLCVLSIYSGMGILLLFKFDIGTKKLLFLSPFIAQVLIALLLNVSIQLKIPVRSSYFFIWAAFIAFGVYGFVQSRKREIGKYKWLMAAWAILPLMIVGGPYWYGSATKFGDVLPDGWNYITIGQYLWRYPLGAEGGLSPLYQYASTFSDTRFTSSAFLALFSSLFRQHDTATSSGIYLGWIIFVFAGTCSFFISDKDLSERKKCLYVILAVFSGWVWNVLWATNYDNLLALAYAPMLIEVFRNTKYFTKPWAVFLGLITAVLMLVYLELTGLIVCILFIMLLVHFIQANATDRKGILAFVFVLSVVGLFVLLPFSRWIFTFLSVQLDAVLTKTVRPGQGLFLGLLKLQCAPSAFWAMGCEQSLQDPWLYTGGEIITKGWLLTKNILAWILSFFALGGIVWLVQRKKWSEIIPLFVIGLTIGYMLFVQRYPYGAYKFVLLLWWLIPYLLMLGIQCFEEFEPFHSRFIPALLYLPLLLLLLLTAFRISYTVVTKPAFLRSDYAEVRNVAAVTQGRPILVNVDNWLGSAWANYYLRDQDTFLDLKRTYMAKESAAINRSKKINIDDIRYVLIDGLPENSSLQERTWTGKPYSLWKLSKEWILPGDIQNTNGVENWAGKISFWLGKEKVVFPVLSSFEGTAIVIAEFSPGPSLSPGQPASIEIWNEIGFREQIKLASKQYILLSIPVKKGKNQLFMQSLDEPAILPLPNGDPRVLLAGVSIIRYFNASTNDVSLIDIVNLESNEHFSDSSPVEIGKEAVKITFFASQAGHVKIMGDFSPVQSFPNSTQWKLLVQTDSGYMSEIIIPENSIQVPARQGLNEITIQVLDRSTLQELPQGDKKALIRISNLRLAYQAEKP